MLREGKSSGQGKGVGGRMRRGRGIGGRGREGKGRMEGEGGRGEMPSNIRAYWNLNRETTTLIVLQLHIVFSYTHFMFYTWCNSSAVSDYHPA